MRAVPLLVFLAACSAKLSGSITIDGKPLDISSCRSGQPMGFAGIQIEDDAGRRLRLVANADGTANAILFAGEAQGDEPPSQIQLHIVDAGVDSVPAKVEGKPGLR